MAGQDTVATRQLLDAEGKGGLQLVAICNGRTIIYPLPESGERVLGRSKECDVLIDDPSLSRKHARLRLGAEITIEDLGTLNGTRVREQRIEPGRPVPIRPGEVLDLGSVTVVLQRRRSAAEGSASAATVPDQGAIGDLHRLADRIAPGMISVLIQGETGAGKEVLAARIHGQSPRAKKPYLRINCAALSESLLESELFGHERGAFTGAAQAKPGLLETADGGTILLDEIGELTMALQVKLLRVIEQREVLRVGGLNPRPIDVRFLAATNKDLEEEARQGRFREDLYFRLAGITLTVPPLRERVAEIPALATSLVAEVSARIGRSPPPISPEALRLLEGYGWPGNVRELRNVVERAALLAGADAIRPEHLPLDKMAAGPRAAAPVAVRAPTSAEDVERQQILDALARCGGSQTKAAELLGISRRTLTNRLNALALPRPRKG